MLTRKLGYTDLNLSVIGLGASAMGGGGCASSQGPQDDNDSLAAIRKALDEGINWIDTAPFYGLGHSEEIVGKAIKGMQERPLIATKCGMLSNRKGEILFNLKKQSIRREIDASLKRLGIDVIDLYQIHWPRPDEDIEEGWSTMAELVKEGKTRYIGVSNFSVDQLKRIQPIHPAASIQPPYSMIERDIETELLGFCGKNKIGVIVYSPMQAGLLTGKFTKERVRNLPDDDWRKTRGSHFQEPDLTANIELVERLKPIAENQGRTVAQLAVAWTLRRPEVTSAIVGARRPSQIREITPAAGRELKDADASAIESLIEKRKTKLSSAAKHQKVNR